ncbi:MAG: NAD(P)-binding domain-containing protein [Nisaea sp.]|uniref:flavin-containing monooxygenase n=1 Tax=Nisaea sp. TaxID=2024842 RepID=UPI001B1C3B40|nr:NAD(P)/FAD-dependent oxidoreductase [Nisaea sp.]MBO6560939.1 NAD(P)-binding domain-containing protein [Nisaea sp.]
MSVENINTLVIGAGQAGIAMSEHLGKAGIPHLVLERGRIAERWRSERWDSLVANGPAWHDRFPGMEFPDADPDSFIPKEKVADYFADYAEMIAAPVRSGVEVTSVLRNEGRPGFHVETTEGSIEADNVVIATGPFQIPVIPPVVPASAGIAQLHSSAYRNPDQLGDGGVIVVGAGSSGVQIADELNRSGRKVILSVGPHHRPPRAYRGRDYCWWLGVLGLWDIAAPKPGTEHIAIAVSGARGGETVDFRNLARQGITLVGLTEGYEDGSMRFAGDLARNIAEGDENYLSVLRQADAFAARNGLDLPLEPEAHVIGPDPDCVANPIRELELRAAGIGTILWATGFRTDYDWLKVDAFDADGRPRHQRGVSSEPGIYFLGLPWLSRRGSSFIWGVWHDAMHIADQIAIQRSYLDYDAAVRARGAAE